ncbi:MAG: succinate dehydrogenase, hydrophobic rane anchor protein [Pseudomonadota bacterium]|jgi:succinate dehydrogenase / fumarate reductase membrane anchor subunit
MTSPVREWWHQRITALALIPLTFWLLVFLNKALHLPYAEIREWLASVTNSLAIAGWWVLVLYHAGLGIQVVLEDYISTLTLRHRLIWISRGLFFVIGCIGIAALILIVSGQ